MNHLRHTLIARMMAIVAFFLHHNFRSDDSSRQKRNREMPNLRGKICGNGAIIGY